MHAVVIILISGEKKLSELGFIFGLSKTGEQTQ
jgi:hypothetical protein